jgi:hypothetical protein
MLTNNVIRDNLVRLPVLQLINVGADCISILVLFVKLKSVEAFYSISGPRELNGAVDLISHYKLSAHHDFFCKRPLPAAISDTHYLHNVVGDTEIRKGEGMELDQLVRNGLYSCLKDTASANIRKFDLEMLGRAFQLRETTPVDLPSVSMLT